MLPNLGEWGPPGSRLLSSAKHSKIPAMPRISVQKLCSILTCLPGAQGRYVNGSPASGSLPGAHTCGASAGIASLQLLPSPGA